MTDLEGGSKNHDKFNRADDLIDDDENSFASWESKLKHTCCIKPYTPYLDEEAKESVRNFKYRGGDIGFFYKIFWSPVSAWIVERIPEWFNPNILTLTGFSFIVMPFLILFVNFGTSMSDDTPRIPIWFNIMFGLCYFTYRMFDEMDGK